MESSIESSGIGLLGGRVGEIVVELFNKGDGARNIFVQSAYGYGNTISGKWSVR